MKISMIVIFLCVKNIKLIYAHQFYVSLNDIIGIVVEVILQLEVGLRSEIATTPASLGLKNAAL